MAGARSVIFNVIGHDNASKAFLSASKSAETAATGVDRSIKRMEAAGARLQGVGQRLTKSITLPVVAAAAVSVKLAVDFQKSMTLLQTAGGESEKKMAVISKGIMNVAKDTGTSLHDLSEGMYTVAKAGSQKWSAIDQLKVLKAAAQGAKSENVDLGTATNALTSIMMSYHASAGDAVKIENQLIVASGRSKTTFQEFSNALSTVAPIASAAHVSFAQVGAAIATMTQHGTSADEATQELSHTIRNLQRPNGAAIKAMQQLGLSSVDLGKNLGKRGLSGTIDLVTNAIEKKMGKSGLVVTSAFKQSQAASADLSTMLLKMPKPLADISAGLLRGTVGITKYSHDVKELGGTAGAQGLQFLSLYKSSKGFNDLLKSGSPQARTFAGTLRDVLGTATSMNTALQLGGENMTYFKTTASEVAKAAKHSGVDVLGWAKTQDTLAVKMDKAKANLQVLAVEIGTALIPAVTKIVGWVSKAVQWFDGLSGSNKKLIGTIVLVGAALGPVLAILGRLTKGFAILWGVGVGATRLIAGIRGVELSIGAMQSRAYLAGLSLRSSFTGGITAVRGLGAAMAGIGIGAMVGTLTRGSSTGVKAIGALGSAAAGAAIGFSMGGPLGAAIGGLGAGLTSLATSFIGAGDATRHQIKPTQELTDAIRQDNDALGKNTALIVANKLEQGGLYDAGLKLGISQKTLTNAATGNSAALRAVQAAIFNSQPGYDALIASGGKLTKTQQATHDAAALLSGSLVGLAAELDVNKRAANNIDAGLGKTKGTLGATGKAAASAGGMLGTLGAALVAISGKSPNINISPITSKLAKVQSDIDAIRQNKVPGFEVNTLAGQRELARLQAQIDRLQGKQVTISVDTYNRSHAVKVAASGGYISGPGSGTSDSIPARLSNGEFVINAKATSRHLGLLHAINSGAKGYAAGGLVGSKLSDVVSGIAGLLASGHNRLSTGADLRDAAKSLRDAARSAKVSAGEYANMLRQSGALSRLGASRDSVSARLGSGPTAPTAYDKLAAAKGRYSDAYSSVRGAGMGSFDVTSAGVNAQVYNDQPAAPVSAGSILAQLQKAAANAARFGRLLRRLGAEGLPHTLLMQLAQAGPAAMDQAVALSQATPKQMLAVKASYAALSASSAASGSYVAKTLYGAGVHAAQGLVNGLLSKQTALNKAIRKMVDGMTGQLKRSLGIHSPSKVMHGLGVNTAEGFRLGVASHHDAIEAEGNRMAHKVQPKQSASAARSYSEGGDTFHIYEQNDPVGTAHAVIRMRQMAGRR